jgi:hypothetical protein
MQKGKVDFLGSSNREGMMSLSDPPSRLLNDRQALRNFFARPVFFFFWRVLPVGDGCGCEATTTFR